MTFVRCGWSGVYVGTSAASTSAATPAPPIAIGRRRGTDDAQRRPRAGRRREAGDDRRCGRRDRERGASVRAARDGRLRCAAERPLAPRVEEEQREGRERERARQGRRPAHDEEAEEV